MWIADNWQEYELIDSSDGERLERWGDFVFLRPDPQVVWKTPKKNKLWHQADAYYFGDNKGSGQWRFRKTLPESWTVSQDNLTFKIKPMGLKQMGLFPEQLANWSWFSNLIKNSNRNIKVLNLFAYTGGATVAAAKAGAMVCHVDASKGMVSHAKENATLSEIPVDRIRYIVDDCMKFVDREIRRGNKYDAVIMDPPSFGRGPKGEVWKIEKEIYGFIEKCINVLSDDPLFMLLNSYTTGLSAATAGNVLAMALGEKYVGAVTSQEIGIPMSDRGYVLPCGSSARWEKL